MCIFWADCTKSISIPNEKAPAIGRGFSPARRLRRASRAAAPGKSRTLSFLSLHLARTRLIPGARLRRASRAPCLFLSCVSHVRGSFRVWAHAELLFSQANRNPASCSLRPGGNPPGKSPRQTSMNTQNVGPNVPPRTETPEKLELCSFGFSGVSLSAGGLRPNGRLSRPAAREKGKSAAGHWNGVRRGEALLRIFVYFLFGRK